MNLRVNGHSYDTASATVRGLLEELEYPLLAVAVQVNDTIVPRAQYDATPLADGDRVEVITFAAGG